MMRENRWGEDGRSGILILFIRSRCFLGSFNPDLYCMATLSEEKILSEPLFLAFHCKHALFGVIGSLCVPVRNNSQQSPEQCRI